MQSRDLKKSSRSFKWDQFPFQAFFRQWSKRGHSRTNLVSAVVLHPYVLSSSSWGPSIVDARLGGLVSHTHCIGAILRVRSRLRLGVVSFARGLDVLSLGLVSCG